MGGTSADISLIENYTPQVSNERYVEGYPARIPMINIITIGAGGGSIAKIDDGGALKVGPKSAGALLDRHATCAAARIRVYRREHRLRKIEPEEDPRWQNGRRY